MPYDGSVDASDGPCSSGFHCSFKSEYNSFLTFISSLHRHSPQDVSPKPLRSFILLPFHLLSPQILHLTEEASRTGHLQIHPSPHTYCTGSAIKRKLPWQLCIRSRQAEGRYCQPPTVKSINRLESLRGSTRLP